MRRKTGWTAALLLLCAAGLIFYLTASGRLTIDGFAGARTAKDKTTVRLWYHDEALTNYLTRMAVAYNEESEEVRIVPVYQESFAYLDSVYEASMKDEAPPDLFIVSHDTLEKAVLSGIAGEVDDTALLNGNVFPAAALSSVRYHNWYVAYPYYFETAALLYNRTYLEEAARAAYEAEQDAAEGARAMEALEEIGGAPQEEAADGEADEDAEDAEGEAVSPDAADGETDGEATGSAAGADREADDDATDADNGAEMPTDGGDAFPTEADAADAISDAELAERTNRLLPGYLADILTFAESYNAPEAVEAVFRWDVTDIFYNYFFVGNYLNFGGDAGDDVSQINLYNEDTINCLKIYQELRQFFAIDAGEVSYETIMDDFIAGKTVFTVATSDAIARIRAAQESGECAFSFGVAAMPDLNHMLQSRTMSVTNCLVVSEYSAHYAEAAQVARYLVEASDEAMYLETGKLPARWIEDYSDANLDAFQTTYARSVPLPKMLEAGNFWVELEIAFTKIWDGADVNETLRALSSRMKTQLAGEPREEAPIPDPPATAIIE